MRKKSKNKAEIKKQKAIKQKAESKKQKSESYKAVILKSYERKNIDL